MYLLCTGKLPNNLVHERYRKRFNRESFLYAVRFRVGPFGITFDNKVAVFLVYFGGLFGDLLVPCYRQF